MSGGSYNYLCFNVESFADEMRQGTALRKAFAKHLELVAKAMHDIEWVDSGDYSPGDEDEAISAVVGKDGHLEAAVEMANESAQALVKALEAVRNAT